MSEELKTSHALLGKVVSSKMDKTISVKIERVVSHPLYGKFIKRSSTLLAHDVENTANEGDVVVVSSCRPISKRKVWILDRIIEKSK
jgi:small subunit ribosomal protein S17